MQFRQSMPIKRSTLGILTHEREKGIEVQRTGVRNGPTAALAISQGALDVSMFITVLLSWVNSFHPYCI